MWLVNLSESNNEVLYKNWIRWEDVKDTEQAMQFQRVVRVCYAFGIHSCADWKLADFYCNRQRARDDGELLVHGFASWSL